MVSHPFNNLGSRNNNSCACGSCNDNQDSLGRSTRVGAQNFPDLSSTCRTMGFRGVVVSLVCMEVKRVSHLCNSLGGFDNNSIKNYGLVGKRTGGVVGI